MGRYLIRRAATGLVTLFGITVVTFAIIQLAPGDPARLQVVVVGDANAIREPIAALGLGPISVYEPTDDDPR